MGFIIIFTITPLILLVLGLILLKGDNKLFLILLLFFIIPIGGMAGSIFNENCYKGFKRSYSYISNLDFEQLDMDGKIAYMKDAERINREIEYAEENCDSFWFGIFTDSRVKQYKKIEL